MSCEAGMIQIRNHPEGVVFDVRVQPRSSKNSIAGDYAGALKIRLTAPPVDNAANRMCITFLAKCLGVSKSSLEIITGHTGRHKQVLLRAGIQKISKNQYHLLKQRIEKLIES